MEEKSLEKLVNEIYEDSNVSPLEVIKLRKFCESAIVALLKAEANNGLVDAMCKSFEVTTQLLQQSLLKIKKANDNAESKKALILVIESQIELLKVNLSAFNK